MPKQHILILQMSPGVAIRRHFFTLAVERQLQSRREGEGNTKVGQTLICFVKKCSFDIQYNRNVFKSYSFHDIRDDIPKTCWWGSLSITVIVIRKRIGDQSSNLRQDYLHFIFHWSLWERHESICSFPCYG